MNNNQFLQQGEIFSNSNEEQKTRLPKINYRPSNRMKTVSIVAVTAVAFFTAGLMIPSDRPEASAQHAAPANSPVNAAPARVDAVNTPEFNLISNHTPETRTPSAQALPALNQAAIGAQQQLFSQMQACLQNAAQAQQAANVLRSREAALDAQRDSLNERSRGIDTDTPAGRDARRQLEYQRDQVDVELRNTRRALSDLRRQFSDVRSDCRRRINDLRSARRNAENQMNRAFNDAFELDTSRQRTNTNNQ